MKCKIFILILISNIIFSLPVNAFDKALNNFKNEVENAFEEFEKDLKKLKNSNLEIAQSLDLANDEFEDLLKFAEETLNDENIHATIDAIEFLSSNINSAIKIIPSETITTMAEIDFSSFKDEDMKILNEIMTDMNRKKMDDFKEMVTSMVVLEKQGFEAEMFMDQMQELEMGLTMLNDDTLQLEFDVAGLSDKSLDEVSKDLDKFENNFENLKAAALIEKVSNISENVDKNTSKVQTKVDQVSSNVGSKVEVDTVQESSQEISSSLNETKVDDVQVEITVELEVPVKTSTISETTKEVANVVESSNVANSVSETTEEIQDVVYSFSSSTQSFTFTADELSDAQLAMANSGLLSIANATDKVWDYNFHNVNGEIDAFQEATGRLLNYNDINSLEENIKNQVVDLALSAGRFDMIDEKAQVQIMCEAGKADNNNKVNLSGTKGNIEGESRGDWDCGNL